MTPAPRLLSLPPLLWLFGCLLTVPGIAGARGVYQAPEAFLEEVFGGDVPAPEKLWVNEAMKPAIRDILGHDLAALRLSYWRRDDRTAWILEEIGRDLPITAGLVVNGGAIETVRILIFRESRGWEVRYPFFTDQFRGAALDDEGRLDTGIDGISGATLSVRAVRKLATLALYFHGVVTD